MLNGGAQELGMDSIQIHVSSKPSCHYSNSAEGTLMGGERVQLLKARAKKFSDLGFELLNRGVLDLAAFNIQQSCQLTAKTTLLRLIGEALRVYSVRELLGMLSARLEEIGFREVSDAVKHFVKKYKEVLADIDSAYTASRYTLFTYTASDVNTMAEACSELHKLLEDVEKHVLG